MNDSNYRLLLFVCLLVLPFSYSSAVFAESAPLHGGGGGEKNALEFIPNQNQCNSKVNYSVGLGNMDKLFLTDEGFTYIFHNNDQVEELHDILLIKDPVVMKNHRISGHVYNIDFIGADLSMSHGHDSQKHKYNFFRGNNPEKWASNVPVFHETEFTEMYPNINMKVYSDEGMPKYDFIINPGGDPNLIRSRYEGTDQLYLRDGNLIIQTSINTVIEAAPIAYQLINGIKVLIDCKYELDGDILSYSFPNGYGKGETLIIDPTVIGATLSGFTGVQIFGNTSCFDNSGNIYNGGTAYDIGLATTPGAFQTNYADPESGNSSLVDMAFHKYNSDASELIYGTYVGGVGFDIPHSTIVDNYGQLCILGSTSASDFPTTTNAYQSQFGGQTDIVIVKLSSDGTSLIGSTFLGGEDNDGLNLSLLEDAYGDKYRGEIILDNQGDIYITSVTSSVNFPVTPNAYQPALNSQNISQIARQDAVVLKINSDLSTLFWSTYLGGDNADTGYGIRIDDEGSIYVTGIAGESNFADINSLWPGGIQSAYVVKLSANGQNLLKGIFYGTNGIDHSYFLDIDEDDNVHIYGRTTGDIVPTPNTYTYGSNKSQFITAFNKDLDEIIYQTTIGNNDDSEYSFVPAAFMVDKCNSIYFSGYYASQDLPTTADAILSNVTQDAFYLGVLTPNAEELSFGTYFGNADHVDGGTSRFDKGGIIYQGVCSCVEQDRTLNTSSNAYAQIQESRCDMGMFKIDFDIATVTAKAAVLPGSSGCAPFAADFTYTGQDGEEFLWDFGDGTTTTSMNPSHTFDQSGEYMVTLIASSVGTCNVSDTTTITINVLNGESTTIDTTYCQSDNFLFLDATIPNGTFLWQDGSSTSTYVVVEPGIYWVDISTAGCSQRDSFIVSPPPNQYELDLGADLQLCDELSYDITTPLENGITYEWSTNQNSNTISITESGTYGITVTDALGCLKIDEIDILMGVTPNLGLGNDTTLCQGVSILLSVPDEDETTYEWQDGSTENILLANSSGTYSLTAENNGCINTEEFLLSYAPQPDLIFDTQDINCFDECNGTIAINNQSTANINYQWPQGINLEELCPGSYIVTMTDQFNCQYEEQLIIESPELVSTAVTFNNVSCAEAMDGFIEIATTGGVTPYQYEFNNTTGLPTGLFSELSGGIYNWQVIDANGCEQSGVIDIYEPPIVEIYAGTDTTIELGSSTLFDSWVMPQENQTISWDNWTVLDCSDCITPLANPVNTTLFEMTVTDQTTGCEIKDQVEVRVQKDRTTLIPNVISPNGDGQNDWLSIFGNKGIRQIRTLKIFDRWGELIFIKQNFQANNHNLGWDGKFNGKDVVPGVYVYLAEVEYLDDHIEVLSGDITVLK